MFSGVGVVRAAQFKQKAPVLGNAVWKCWQLSEEQGNSVGKPLADAVVEYLPDTWLETVGKGIDPTACIANLFLVVRQCQDNEEAVIARYMDHVARTAPVERGPVTDVPVGAAAAAVYEEAYGDNGAGGPAEEDLAAVGL